MTAPDYTDLCAQGEAARWNLLYSSRDPETGDDLFPGTFVHLSVEDANGAAVTITALIAAIRDLEAQKRELALDVLAASGQSQEAYQAQLATEAKLAEVERERDEYFDAGTRHLEAEGKALATVAAQAAQIEAMRGALELIADTDPDEGTAWFHTVANAALTTEEGHA